jgi:hypothetical protein
MNRIERWTQKMLEAEARKRGIRDPELRSSAELMRLVVRHDYTLRRGLRGARKLLDTLIDGAAAVLPGATRARTPLTASTKTAPVHAATPRDLPTAPSPVPQQAEARRESVSTTAAGSSEVSPNRDSAARAAPPPSASALAPSTPTQPPSDRLEPVRLSARQLQLRWQISAASAERARAVLGAQGELTLRIVAIRADPASVVHSEITEHAPVEIAGEWLTELDTDATHCVSSIGVRQAGRFVSIVHASSRALSVAEPIAVAARGN